MNAMVGVRNWLVPMTFRSSQKGGAATDRELRKVGTREGCFALIDRSRVRALITLAAVGGGLLLAGCNTEQALLASNSRANQPVPPKLVADMTTKEMDLQSPILIRLFKQEAELEVWKQDHS